MKVICILFNVGKNKDEITKDSKLRLFAGAELARENKESVVLFVGGGGLAVSGAELLERFWIDNLPEMKNECFALDSSNNTFDNLKEVQDFIGREKLSFQEMDIVSSLYHRKRLRRIAARLDMEATILAAEEILISKGRQAGQVREYLDSAEYKRKTFLEIALNALMLLDSKQSMIRFWRWLIYRMQ